VLCVFMHHWRYYDCGSIIPVFQAIAATKAVRSEQGIHLNLEHWSIGPFDEELGLIAAQPGNGLSTVFEDLTSLRLNLQFTEFTNEHICGPDHFQWATMTNFARLWCRAQSLRELELTGDDSFAAPLMRILVRDATWPLLNSFTLDVRSGRISQRYDLARSFGGVGRVIPNLPAFLLRHATTLEHIYLRRALRDDRDPWLSTELLRPALQQLRQGLVNLKRATVIEDLENLLLVDNGIPENSEVDAVPNLDTLLAQKPHEEVLKKHRPYVKESDLGQTGRELGAIYSEDSNAATREYILEYHNDMGLGPKVGQRGVWSFDFGPYVLGGRQMDELDKEQGACLPC